MAEKVNTGGLVNFRYDLHNVFELDANRKQAIETGYAEADERKKKERRNKWLFWIVAVLILVLILGYILIKK